MQFNVAQLLRQATGATRHYEVDEPSEIADPNLSLIGPTRGQVSFLRTQRGILVTAQLTQTVRVECVRCLAEMEVPLTIQIEEEFFPTIDLKTGLPITWTEEDEVEEASLIDEKHTLDLLEVTRQELLLALPAHPLCRLDCAGLCPVCGADRNVEACDCRAEQTDPRWGELVRFGESAEAE